MRSFVYRGFDQNGKSRKGIIDAIDSKDAREKLAGAGILVETIRASSESKLRTRAAMKPVQRAYLYQNLASMLHAGLPLTSAIEMIMQSPGQESILPTLASIRDSIREGDGLALSLQKVNVPLSGYEISVLESGERAGNLARSLQETARYLEDDHDLKQKITSALVYPAIIIGLALLIAVAVLGFLVPRLSGLLMDAGMELPLITRCLLFLGNWFVPVFATAAMVIALMTLYFRSRWKQKGASRERIERWFYTNPITGKALSALTAVRFSRTAALLIGSGIPVVDAMELSAGSTGSVWIHRRLMEEAELVRNGKSFGDSIASIDIISPTLSGWIQAGEAGGNLPNMLHQAADRGNVYWINWVNKLTKLLEPVLIILVGLFVLLVALGILLPVLSMNSSIG